MADLFGLQKTPGITFNGSSLLEQVVVYGSFINVNLQLNLESNECLEFLGDAILAQQAGPWGKFMTLGIDTALSFPGMDTTGSPIRSSTKDGTHRHRVVQQDTKRRLTLDEAICYAS